MVLVRVCRCQRSLYSVLCRRLDVLTTDILHGLIGLPGVAALLAVLYQILRDEAAQARAVDLQEKQQIFHLGVASPMANVVFDKRVQFSQQYITRLQEV